MNISLPGMCELACNKFTPVMAHGREAIMTGCCLPDGVPEKYMAVSIRTSLQERPIKQQHVAEKIMSIAETVIK